MTKLAILLFVVSAACGGSDTQSSDPSKRGDDGITLGDRSGDRRSVGPGTEDDADDADGVEIEGLKGHLAPYDIEKGIKKHSAGLSDCYNGRLAGRRYVGGSVELSYVVKRNGNVKSVHLSKSDLGDWGMELCLLEVSRTMVFAKPKGGEAEFAVPLDFNPRQKAMWWGDDRTTTEVGDKSLELASCADKSGSRAPSALWVTAYVGTRGKVGSVGFAAPNGGLADAWATCAAEVVAGWELSDPKGKVAKMSFQYHPE